MEYIFELAIQIVMAYFQIVMIFFGAVFILFGGSVFLSMLQNKKKRGYWINATVSAIREGEGIADEDGIKGKVYYPVFEAVGPNGDMVRYEYKARGFGIDKFKVGMRCKVLPLEKEPGFVAIEGDAKSDVFIMCFLLSAGGMMLGLPLIFIPITPISFIIWGVTAFLMILKFRKLIKPKHLRETVAAFKARQGRETLSKHQDKREIPVTEIIQQKQKLEKMGTVMSKVGLIVGFLILCVGGIGYNAQQDFIQSATLEKSGPCGLELGEDCKRTILWADALSIVPLELRPVMEGVYHSTNEPDKIIVSYGDYTPMPYFILMAMGALIIVGNMRKLSKT